MKNEVKAVKVAVLAAPGNVLAAPRGMSAAPRSVLAAPHGVPAAPHGVLALQDTHGKSRGAWGTLGGDVLYMKNFYGLELLKNHF